MHLALRLTIHANPNHGLQTTINTPHPRRRGHKAQSSPRHRSLACQRWTLEGHRVSISISTSIAIFISISTSISIPTVLSSLSLYVPPSLSPYLYPSISMSIFIFISISIRISIPISISISISISLCLFSTSGWQVVQPVLAKRDREFSELQRKVARAGDSFRVTIVSQNTAVGVARGQEAVVGNCTAILGLELGLEWHGGRAKVLL